MSGKIGASLTSVQGMFGPVTLALAAVATSVEMINAKIQQTEDRGNLIIDTSRTVEQTLSATGMQGLQKNGESNLDYVNTALQTGATNEYGPGRVVIDQTERTRLYGGVAARMAGKTTDPDQVLAAQEAAAKAMAAGYKEEDAIAIGATQFLIPFLGMGQGSDAANHKAAADAVAANLDMDSAAALIAKLPASAKPAGLEFLLKGQVAGMGFRSARTVISDLTEDYAAKADALLKKQGGAPSDEADALQQRLHDDDVTKDKQARDLIRLMRPDKQAKALARLGIDEGAKYTNEDNQIVAARLRDSAANAKRTPLTAEESRDLKADLITKDMDQTQRLAFVLQHPELAPSNIKNALGTLATVEPPRGTDIDQALGVIAGSKTGALLNSAQNTNAMQDLVNRTVGGDTASGADILAARKAIYAAEHPGFNLLGNFLWMQTGYSDDESAQFETGKSITTKQRLDLLQNEQRRLGIGGRAAPSPSTQPSTPGPQSSAGETHAILRELISAVHGVAPATAAHLQSYNPAMNTNQYGQT
jgi:hypothetical protein